MSKCDLKGIECEYYYKAADAPEGTEDCHWLPDHNTEDDTRPCEKQKEEIGTMAEIGILMLYDFMKDCRKMAEENWCPSQVEMLDRLFKAVSLDKKYDEV